MSVKEQYIVENFGQFEIYPNIPKSGEHFNRVLDTITGALNMPDETILFIDADLLLRVNAKERWYNQYEEILEKHNTDLRPADCTRSRCDIEYEQSSWIVFKYLERASERANAEIHNIEIETPSISVVEERLSETIDAEYEAEYGVKPPPYDVRVGGEAKVITAGKLWEVFIAKHINDEHGGNEEECGWAGHNQQ